MKPVVSRSLSGVMLCAAVTLPAHAGDGHAARLAAIGAGSLSAPLSRLGMPPRPDWHDVDLRVLLTEKGQPVQREASPADDTILVAFALKVPQSVDEEIAKRHELELIERTELPDLGMRIVQYRSTGKKPVSAILSELRHDQRIRRAQLNVQHQLPGPPAPPAVSSLEKTKPALPATARHFSNPRSAQARAPVKHSPAIPAQPLVAAKAETAVAPLGGLGDVLSGGL